MARTSPSGKMNARMGNYRAPVDTTAMEPEMKSMFEKTGEETPYAPKVKGEGILNKARGALKKMGQGFGRLMGNRPTTPEEEAHYKSAGQKAYYNAKANKDYQK